jgi:hypothetical protein
MGINQRHLIRSRGILHDRDVSKPRRNFKCACVNGACGVSASHSFPSIPLSTLYLAPPPPSLERKDGRGPGLQRGLGDVGGQGGDGMAGNRYRGARPRFHAMQQRLGGGGTRKTEGGGERAGNKWDL